MRLITCIIVALSLCVPGCSSDQTNEQSGDLYTLTVQNLNSSGKTIGVCTGTSPVSVMEENFPKAHLAYFPNGPAGYQALLAHRIDAFAYDRHVMNYITLTAPELAIMPGFTSELHLGVGAAKDQSELINRVNEYIRQYKEDGTFEDMFQRWTTSSDPQMPDVPEAIHAVDTITVGTEAVNPPMNFRGENGEIVGFDIEFARRLALFLNVKCEIIPMSWDALLLATQKGKIDLMIAQLDNIPVHRERMLISDDYLSSSIALLVRKENLPGIHTSLSDDEFKSFLQQGSVGIQSGSAQESLIQKKFPGMPSHYFDDVPDLIQALRNSMVDIAFMTHYAFLSHLRKNPDEFRLLIYPGSERGIAIACNKEKNDLRTQINFLLSQYEREGVLEDMRQRWLYSTVYREPELPERGQECPPLHIATSLDLEPANFILKGQPAGFDIELAKRLAYDLEMRPVISNMSFKEVLPAVAGGTADIALAHISKTEERAEKVNFSRPYVFDEFALLVRKTWLNQVSSDLSYIGPAPGTSDSNGSFLSGCENVYHALERTLVDENRWLLFARGLGVTLLITLTSAIFGTLLGFILGILQRSHIVPFAWLLRTLIYLIRSVPLVLFLLFLYYAVFEDLGLSAILASIIAFSIKLGANLASILDDGLNTVSESEIKAAISLGLSRFQRFRLVTFPQAIVTGMARYKSELISLFKATTIVGIIPVEDLTKVSTIIRTRTYEAFVPLLLVILVYLFLAWFFVFLLNAIGGQTHVESQSGSPKRRSRHARS
ncbi:MAG: ABC transporter permease subunit [Planctomycetia bacterium]|nr:ABC transporter permease subunit [Planctomycetia bacterium]